MELEQRVAALEARFAVLEALARSTAAWDARDAAAYAAGFTEDAVLEGYARDEQTPNPCLEGRAAIHDWAREQHQGWLRNVHGHHLDTDVVFTRLEAALAETRFKVLIVSDGGDASTPHVVYAGLVEMAWRREADGWQCSRSVTRRTVL